MRTNQIDAIRRRARCEFNAGDIERDTLSRVQTLCSNADTAGIEGRDADEHDLMHQAVSALEAGERDWRDYDEHDYNADYPEDD
jgi:hypothetical protein